MPKESSTTKGYAGAKQRTNLSLDGDLVELAKQYFPKTRHGSLSGFVENAIRRAAMADAKKIKANGIKIPSAVFTK